MDRKRSGNAKCGYQTLIFYIVMCRMEETVRDRNSRCQTATEICEVILNQVYKQRKSTIQEVQEVLGLHRSALADSEHHQIRKKHK